MREVLKPDEASRLFAEETDASATLGRAPDAAERMAEIHARHDAALVSLRAREAAAGAVDAQGDKAVQHG